MFATSAHRSTVNCYDFPVPRIKPPFFALSYLVLAYLGQRFVPPACILPEWAGRTGVGVLAVSILLMASAIVRFRKADTTLDPSGKPSVLLRGGPYRFTRNPIYLGFACVQTGLALALRAPVMLVAPVAFVLTMNTLFVPYEERNLERKFGAKYRAYCRRTKRWL